MVALLEIDVEQDGGGQPLPAPLSAESCCSFMDPPPFHSRLLLVAVPHL